MTAMAALAAWALLVPADSTRRAVEVEWQARPAPIATLANAVAVEPVVWRPLRRPLCPPQNCPPCPPGSVTPPSPSDTPSTSPSPATDNFAAAGQGGTMAPASFDAGMFGDLTGFSGTRVLYSGYSESPVIVQVPAAALGGGIKISDYESPRPQDRAFYHFNNFSYVNAYSPNLPPTHLARHILGFEKTLFAGNASVGLRLPFVNIHGNPQLAESQFSNMSIILKYAPRNDQPGGNVISGGVAFTVPTGRDLQLDLLTEPGNPFSAHRITLNATYFQPYLAFIRYLTPRLFVHGFSALLAPSDSRLVTLFTNDIGLVMRLLRPYAEGIIRGIMPTLEVHINTPLNHRGVLSQPVGFSDNVNLTAGCTFLLQRATLGWAIATPVTVPRPFSVEVITSLNFRF